MKKKSKTINQKIQPLTEERVREIVREEFSKLYKFVPFGDPYMPDLISSHETIESTGEKP